MPRKAAIIDQEKIAQAVRQIIAGIGEDAQREGLAETPRRIAQMYAELFAGLHRDPAEVLRTAYRQGPGRQEDMVILRDIPFSSLCEHHFLPFHGLVHVGYVPNGCIIGISKIGRLVDILAKRPQVQERLTGQIADYLLQGLNADGVAVVVEAEHFCMTMRGVNKPGSRVVTTAVRGPFQRGVVKRDQFLGLVQPYGPAGGR